MIAGEFDEEILQDLINEGYESDTLLQKFKEMRGKVPATMENLYILIVNSVNTL